MQVTQEQIDPCKVALTITVDPEKVAVAKNKAFGQFAQNLQLPGFRKGKVPPHMARAYVDEGRVKQRAAEILIEPAYYEALQETQIQPYAMPDVELVEMNDDGPFVFKALVPLRPVVTLGPYKGLSVERPKIEVTDADIDRQIEQLQARFAEFDEIADRTAQTGDIAFADLQAKVEGEDDDAELGEPRATAIEIGKNIPDFDNGLVGMAIGETKTIDAVYPDDFPDEVMRGKRATFTVTLKELKSRRLPELNDELAKKINANVDTMDALRAEVRERLQKSADEIGEDSVKNQLLSAVVKTSQINFPELLLRDEMQNGAKDLQERLQRENATLDQYLEAVGKTREEVEQELAAQADLRIRNSLVLAKVAEAETLNVDDADIDAEIAERAASAKVSPAAVRAFIEKQGQLDLLRSQALTKKVFSFLQENATITDKVVTSDDPLVSQVADPAEDEAADEAESPESPA